MGTGFQESATDVEITFPKSPRNAAIFPPSPLGISVGPRVLPVEVLKDSLLPLLHHEVETWSVPWANLIWPGLTFSPTSPKIWRSLGGTPGRTIQAYHTGLCPHCPLKSWCCGWRLRRFLKVQFILEYFPRRRKTSSNYKATGKAQVQCITLACLFAHSWTRIRRSVQVRRSPVRRR